MRTRVLFNVVLLCILLLISCTPRANNQQSFRTVIVTPSIDGSIAQTTHKITSELYTTAIKTSTGTPRPRETTIPTTNPSKSITEKPEPIVTWSANKEVIFIQDRHNTYTYFYVYPEPREENLYVSSAQIIALPGKK